MERSVVLGPGEGPRLHLRSGFWEQRRLGLPSQRRTHRKERAVGVTRSCSSLAPLGVTVAQQWRDLHPPSRLEGSRS